MNIENLGSIARAYDRLNRINTHLSALGKNKLLAITVDTVPMDNPQALMLARTAIVKSLTDERAMIYEELKTL